MDLRRKNANLQQYAWNSSDAQLWKFVKADNGTYYIRSKLGTTIGLATSNVVSGTNVCMDQVNGNNIQKWVLKKSGECTCCKWKVCYFKCKIF